MGNEQDLVDQIIGEGRHGAPPVDSEFLADFLAETREHLERIELDVMELERAPENQENVHGLFRSFHTIKGLAGFVGQAVVARVAHRTETVLDDCRKKVLLPRPSVASAILRSADLIQRLCAQLALGQDETFLEEVDFHVDRLDRRDFGPEESTVTPRRAETSVCTPEPLRILTSLPEEEHRARGGDPEMFGNALSEEKPEISSDSSALEEPRDEDSGTVEPPVPETREEKTPPSGAEFPQGGDLIRVSAAKVRSLVSLLGELLVTQSQIERDAVDRFGPHDGLVTRLDRLSRLTRELRGLSMSLGMVSLKSMFQKLRRLGRDTAATLGKEVELQFFGEDTEIDRSVAEKLLDPLVHLVKNAISHGVEGRELRLSRGKSPGGTVSVRAQRCRGVVRLEVRDDGGGIDGDGVRRKALERGLVAPGASLTEEDMVELLFLPGFSTATSVDGVSGRGVGMDVVRTEISHLGGRVEVQNTPGKGCAFVLEIPVTMALLDGTIVDIGGVHYIVPTLTIRWILPATEELWVCAGGSRVLVRVRSQLIPLVPAGELLGHPPSPETELSDALVLVLETDQGGRAMTVRGVVERQEVVVQPLDGALHTLEFFSGASILDDGRVSFILDVDALGMYGGGPGCGAERGPF